jgi:hypothetical protein
MNQIRKRQHRSVKLGFKITAIRWESFADIIYIIGGIFFVIGSVFFLPRMANFGDTGVWIFIIGSFLYLIVTGHDLIMSIKLIIVKNKITVWSKVELFSAFAYTIGTITYLIGSVLFLSTVDHVFAGACCFIIGSLLFLIDASINVLEITNEHSVLTLQLVNATEIMYITGSLLFLVASVPYIWQGISLYDKSIIYNYVAIEYIAGSFLFTLGGLFSMIKTYKMKY